MIQYHNKAWAPLYVDMFKIVNHRCNQPTMLIHSEDRPTELPWLNIWLSFSERHVLSIWKLHFEMEIDKQNCPTTVVYSEDG